MHIFEECVIRHSRTNGSSGCGCMDWIELAQDRQVAGTYECGNEPLGSVKYGDCLDWLKAG